MGDLTKNFSLYEFRQRNPYLPVPDKYRANVQRLANQLQALRDYLGKPITISSGWRSLAKNTKIKGATKSQHLTAKAADFVVPGATNKEVYCAILHLIKQGKMEEGGLGWYGEKTATRTPHIHYDVRGSKARWNKTSGALPVCPKIVPAPPQEEDEDMGFSSYVIRTEGEPDYWEITSIGARHLQSGDELRAMQRAKVIGDVQTVSTAAKRRILQAHGVYRP